MDKPLVMALLLVATAASRLHADDQDAAGLYLQAGHLVEANYDHDIMTPAASNLTYNETAPYPAEWYRYEEADYPANQPARDLARRCRSLTLAHWPGVEPKKIDPLKLNPALNSCRALTNELSDSAIFEHLHGHNTEALETIRDILHLADLLESDPDGNYPIQLLVAAGVRAVALGRTNLIMLALPDKLDGQGTAVTKDNLTQLLHQFTKLPDVRQQVEDSLKLEAGSGEKALTAEARSGFERTLRRASAERGMSAVIIACHLFKSDTGHWPASLGDLGQILPEIPNDPFGDGKQSIGYVLIPNALRDGADRPLVYDRESDAAPLAYREAMPAYSFYNQRGRTGQFRDLVFWSAKPAATATTKPLQTGK